MKKLILGVLAIGLVASSSLTSCKKGENDPFLSLRSRKARVAGEWTIKTGSQTDSFTSGGNTTSSVSTVSETTLTVVDNSSGTSVTYVYNIGEFSMTFEKDGTFKSTTTLTLASIDGTAVSGQTASTESKTGHWTFLGKDKDGDYKNKERIVMTSTSVTNTQGSSTSTTTYTGNQETEVWVIDQLKNKEMIVTADYSDSDGTSTSSTVASYTLTQ